MEDDADDICLDCEFPELLPVRDNGTSRGRLRISCSLGTGIWDDELGGGGRMLSRSESASFAGSRGERSATPELGLLDDNPI